MMPQARLFFGDCFDALARLDPASVGLVLADPPYGNMRNAWDIAPDAGALWPMLRRVCAPSASVLMFAASPFDKALALSNPAAFRFEWIWEKNNAKGFLNAKKRPLVAHENVLVFCESAPFYAPQKDKDCAPSNSGPRVAGGTNYGATRAGSPYSSAERYPRSVIRYPMPNAERGLHPTQKPVDLLRYLIRTHAPPGATVLDFTMESGSAGVACAAEGRPFIGIEREPEYFDVATRRLREAGINPVCEAA